MSLQEMVAEVEGLSTHGVPEGGVKNTVRTGTYRNREVFIKYSGTENLEDVKRGFEACSVLKEEIKVPEPIRIVEKDEEVVAIFERLDISYPDRENWQDKDFCRETVEKSIETLEKLQKSKKIRLKAQNSDILSEDPGITKNMREEVEYIKTGLDKDTVEICHEVLYALENKDVDKKFSHNDFGPHNFIFEGSELKGLFDWEYAGFYDPMKDWGKFESTVIDEFVTFFHPEKADEFRELLYENIEREADHDRAQMYRFLQTVVAYYYITNGECSESWKAAGTVEEIRELKAQQLDERKEEVREILEDRF